MQDYMGYNYECLPDGLFEAPQIVINMQLHVQTSIYCIAFVQHPTTTRDYIYYYIRYVNSNLQWCNSFY